MEFPVEIWRSIIREVMIIKSKGPLSRGHLVSVVSVNRAFRAVGDPILWENVVIEEAGQLTAFCNMISTTNKRVAEFIRCLYIECHDSHIVPGPLFSSTYNALYQLETLHLGASFNGYRFLIDPQPHSKLKSLILDGALSRTKDVIAFLASQPSIVELRTADRQFQMLYPPQEPITSSLLPNLQSVQFARWEEASVWINSNRPIHKLVVHQQLYIDSPVEQLASFIHRHCYTIRTLRVGFGGLKPELLHAIIQKFGRVEHLHLEIENMFIDIAMTKKVFVL